MKLHGLVVLAVARSAVSKETDAKDVMTNLNDVTTDLDPQLHRNLMAFTAYTDRSEWEAAVGLRDFNEDFSSLPVDTEFRTESLDVNGNFVLSTISNIPQISVFGSNILAGTCPDGTCVFAFASNSLFESEGESSINMAFTSPLMAWGADFFSTETGSGLNLNLELHCPSGPLTIPLNPIGSGGEGFFGFTLSAEGEAVLDITFKAREPQDAINDDNFEVYAFDNVAGVIASTKTPSSAPSTIPSSVPSTIPSSVPSTSPSSVPSESPRGLPACKSAACIGDPHFNTWSNQWYDFHGICDLVLLSAQGFAVGLDIHIRTKARYEYSYIEAAAIKIGQDILQVGSWGEYFVNGVEAAVMPHSLGGGKFTVYHEAIHKKHLFKIGIGPNDEAIVIKTHKDLVNVEVVNATMANFGSSTGMMGNFVDGSLLARDGVTILDNHDIFGQEWQVTASDGQLFQSPSLHQQCVPAHSIAGRRLGESTISEEAAAMACADQEDEVKKEMCIFDVIAMDDLEVAEIHGAF